MSNIIKGALSVLLALVVFSICAFVLQLLWKIGLVYFFSIDQMAFSPEFNPQWTIEVFGYICDLGIVISGWMLSSTILKLINRNSSSVACVSIYICSLILCVIAILFLWTGAKLATTVVLIAGFLITSVVEFWANWLPIVRANFVERNV